MKQTQCVGGGPLDGRTIERRLPILEWTVKPTEQVAAGEKHVVSVHRYQLNAVSGEYDYLGRFPREDHN